MLPATENRLVSGLHGSTTGGARGVEGSVRLPLCALCIAATAVTAGGASAAELRYTTVEQSGVGLVLATAFGSADVIIVLSINGAASSGPFDWASATWAQKLNWNQWFAISAAVAEPTTGYRLTIKRIPIQRIRGKHRQFCLIASVLKPAAGSAIIARRSWAVHVVKLSRRPFRTRFQYQWTIPESIVLRRDDGKLLAKGATSDYSARVYPAAPGLCR
jgi:hypothetical protein